VDRGYIVPPSSGLVPPVPPSQRCGLCQNFKQTTLTTRLYKVRTNLYDDNDGDGGGGGGGSVYFTGYAASPSRIGYRSSPFLLVAR